MNFKKLKTMNLDKLFVSSRLHQLEPTFQLILVDTRNKAWTNVPREIMVRRVNFGVRQLPLFNHLKPDEREKATAFERSRWKRIEYQRTPKICPARETNATKETDNISWLQSQEKRLKRKLAKHQRNALHNSIQWEIIWKFQHTGDNRVTKMSLTIINENAIRKETNFSSEKK